MWGRYAILIVASLMLFFGCLGKEEQPAAPSQEGPSISVISAGAGQEPGEEELTDEEWMQKALDEQNAFYCLKVPVEMQDECLLPLSNVSLQNCMMLVKYDYEKECLWHHAYAERDTSICDLMRGSDVDDCVRAIAPPCTLETEEASKGRCLAFLHGNYTYCRDDQCFFDFATQNRQSAACSGIQNDIKMDVCTAVIEGGNPCNEYKESNKDLCYYMMAIGKNSTSYCYNINGFFTAEIAYQCFLHFALQNDNKDICEGVGLNNRWNCYMNYSIEKHDLSACRAVDPRAEASRNMCFDRFARTFFQASACNEMNYTSISKTNCYAYVIMAAPSLDFWDCNNVQMPEWRDRCFTNMATLEKNMEYCGYVEDASMKQLCLSKV